MIAEKVGASAPAVDGIGTDGGHMYRAAIDAFAEVASALGDIRDMDDLLHLIASKVSGLVGVSRCSIHLRDDAGVFRGRVGHASKDIDRYVKRASAGMPADGITREILKTKEPVIVADARTDPRPVQSTVRFWGIRSIMAVPMTLGDEVLGIVFLDDEDQAHAFTQTDRAIAAAFGDLAAVAIAHTQRLTDQHSKLELAKRQIHTLKRATALDERLTDLVLEGADLHTITQTLSELMGKPCAVHAADGTCLAGAATPGVDDGILPRLLDADHRERPEVIAALMPCEDQRALLIGPLLDAGLPHRFLVAPLTSGGERAGTLVVMEHLSRFNGADMFVGRRAATLIGLHMSMERNAAEADWNIGASLATELIRGNPDIIKMRRRAEHLGICLTAPHLICLVSKRGDGDDARLSANEVRAAFAAVDPQLPAFVTLLGDDVAVLVAQPEEGDSERFLDALAGRLKRVCEQLSGDRTVVAGISSTCDELEAYPEAYAGVRQAVCCLARFSTPKSPAVVRADDLGPSRLFLSAVDAAGARRFADESVGTLVGDPSATNLIATLQAFFEDMGNIRLCAQRLGVHENTIRYRLARVSQLTGLQITSDPDAQLSARMALLILQLEGRVRGRAATGADEPGQGDLRVVGG